MENMLEFWRCFVFWNSTFLYFLIHARTSSYGKLCVGGSPLSMATIRPLSENGQATGFVGLIICQFSLVLE